MEMKLTRFLLGCFLLPLAFAEVDRIRSRFIFDGLPVFAQDSDTKECTVDRHGKLTSFSGEQVQLTLPCKYALADFTCGDYRVKVTPGNEPTSEDSHSSPVTMWAKIVNTRTEEFIKLRTSLKRLEKYQQGKAENAFLVKEGWLGELDVTGYDASLAALLLKKNDVFDVTFSEEGGVAVRCLVEEFTSDPVPDTWCGDAENTVAMQNGFSELFGDISNPTLQTYVNYHILSDTTVTQSKTCKTLSAKFQSCAAKTEAVTKCDIITNDASTTQCLAQSDTPLETYYSDCVNSVCDGYAASALDATNSYIMDNCNDEPLTEPTTTPTPQTITTQPPPTTTLQPSTTSIPAPWINLDCVGNAKCQSSANNSECFKGYCLCQPGFYYSRSNRSCSKTCNQLVNYYTRYRTADFKTTSSPLYVIDSDVEIELCADRCSTYPACVTMSMYLVRGLKRCAGFESLPDEANRTFNRYSMRPFAHVFQRHCE